MGRRWLKLVALCAIFLLGSIWLPAASAETSVVTLNDLALGTTSSISNDTMRIVHNGLAYFTANDQSNGWTLWRSDGTAAGTFRLTTAQQTNIIPQYLVGYGAYAYIATYTHTDGYSIWKTDGSPNSISKVVSFDSSSVTTGYVKISLMQVAQNTLYFFFAYESMVEVWKLDQALQPVRIKAFRASAMQFTVSSIDRLVEFNGAVYFLVSTTDIPFWGYFSDLWRTDGTPEGTYSVQVIDGRKYARVQGPVVAGGKLIFNSLLDGVVASNGYPNGSEPLFDTIEDGDAPMQLVSVNGIGLLTRYHGHRLWRTDGTVEGTYPIDVNPHGPDNLIFGPVVGNYLYFTAEHPSYGRELWRTNGTLAGTSLVIDGIAGPTSSNPINFATVGKQLYFTATNSQGGVQPWKLDCVGANPQMIGPIDSISANANPGMYLETPQGIVFAANTPALGHEPWLYRESGNTWLKSNAVVATASDQVAAIPVTIGNDGTIMQQTLELTLILTDRVEYLSDTSGITPTIQANSYAWKLDRIAANCNEHSFVVYVKLPSFSLNQHRPFTLQLSGMAPGDSANDNQVNGQLVVGTPLFLPAVQ